MAFKSALTFGLVYIPITLTPAIKNNDIGFNMIDKKTMTRIKYKKTCVDCDDREVKNENIVKGYQYEKDKYVIFTDDDFEKIKSKTDKNITIKQFVDMTEIDPIYFDKSYFVSPVGAEKAFKVLLLAMEKQNKAGIASTVIGTKETLILIRVRQNRMLANTLFYHEEVQKAPVIKVAKTQNKELQLAISLINQMTEKFKPEKFKDEYNIKVKKAIKNKIAGNEIIITDNEPQPTKIINLMEALKRSVQAKAKAK